MKLTWSGSHQELYDALIASGYRRLGDLPVVGSLDERWSHGSLWSLHPGAVPHVVHVHSNNLSLHVERPWRPLLSGRDARCLKLKFSRLDEKRILEVGECNSASAQGIFSHAFYDLSALFLGLLGTLLVLWLLCAAMIEMSREESLPRVLCYQSMAFVRVGVPPYPDLYWYRGASPDWGGALLLAFTQAFLVGIIPLAGLWLSSKFKIFSHASLIGPIVGILTLALVSVGEGWHFFPDVLVWVLGPLAAIPGYIWVTSWRRPREMGSLALPLLLSQVTALVATLAFLYVSWGPALPKSRGGLPSLNTEAFLMIRDEVLKPGTWLTKISDFYYHNTVAAMLPLRPPLGEKYKDRTVLYFGTREDVELFFSMENTLPLVKRTPLEWELIQKGVPLLVDTSRGGPPIAMEQEARSGAQSFELLLVDAELAGTGFWERLQIENPWLVERTAVLHTDRVEMAPSMLPTLETVQGLQKAVHPGTFDRVESAIMAVQFRHDAAASRRLFKEGGFWLLTHLGLPMLLLWCANGILALVTLWPRGGLRRGVSVAVVVGILTWVAPSLADFVAQGSSSELATWNAHRSELTGMHARISQWLERTGPPTDTPVELQQEIKEVHRILIQGYWKDSFFKELGTALSHPHPRVRSRAMASLQRLLSCIHLLDLQVLPLYKMERLQGDRSLQAWTDFQSTRLPALMQDSHSVVCYWALLCAQFTHMENAPVTASLLKALAHADINVRDKAVEALNFRMSPEGMTALAAMVVAHPGGSRPEPCDYVRVNAFGTMLLNHEKFPPSKPLLVPASGQ